MIVDDVGELKAAIGGFLEVGENPYVMSMATDAGWWHT